MWSDKRKLICFRPVLFPLLYIQLSCNHHAGVWRCLWEAQFKKAVITRYSWQLRKKTPIFFIWVFFRDLIRKKQRFKQPVEDLIATWMLFPESDMSLMHQISKTRTGNAVPSQSPQCTHSSETALQVKLRISDLCIDISNEGMLKISACPSFIPTIPALAPGSAPLHALITLANMFASSSYLKNCRYQKANSFAILCSPP